MSTKRQLEKTIQIQEKMIKTLEEQVLVMGDVAKLKDLTMQAIVMAMQAKVSQEDIEKIIPPKESTGDYI